MSTLIIEDDEILARSLKFFLHQCDEDYKHISGYIEAVQYINSLESLSKAHPIILLDVALPDGCGVKLAELINTQAPIPYVIGMSGAASPGQAFKLRELNVKTFLPKPFDLNEFKAEFDRAKSHRHNVDTSQIEAFVGAVPLKTATTEVRRSMLLKALIQSHGNITHAANLLNITRQGVQNMVNEFEINVDEYKPLE